MAFGPELPDSNKARVSRNVDKMVAAGATDAEVEDYLKSEGLSAADETPNEDFSDVSGGGSTLNAAPYGYAKKALNGALFNFGNEAVAGAKSALDPSLSYHDALAQEDLGEEAFDKAHPIGEKLATGAGVLAPIAATGGGSIAAKAGLTGLKGLLAEGTAYGALAGAGGAKEGHRLAGAAGGAAAGAVGTGVLAGAGKLISGAAHAAAPNLLRTIGDYAEKIGLPRGLRPSSNQDVSDDYINKVLEFDQQTPDDIAAAVQANPDTKPEVLLDFAGPNLQASAEGVGAIPGKGKSALRQFLDARRGQRVNRIASTVNDQVSPRVNPEDALAVLRRIRRDNADPLYAAAFEHGAVDDPVMRSILDTPEIRQAFDLARSISRRDAIAKAVREGRPLTRADYALPEIYETGALTRVQPTPGTALARAGESLGSAAPEEYTTELTKRQVPDVRTLHYIKLALDNMAKPGYIPPGGTRSTSNAVNVGVAKAFRDRLRELVPDYATAQDQFAGEVALDNAVDAGRSLFAKDAPGHLSDQIVFQTPGEREMFKLGAADAIMQRIESGGDRADLVRRIAGSPQLRQKLRPAFNSDDEFNAFLLDLDREARMARSEGIFNGSRTTPLRETVNDMAGVGVDNLASLSRGNPLPMILGMLSKADQRTGLKALSDATANRLLAGRTGGRAEILSALDALKRAGHPVDIRRLLADPTAVLLNEDQR